MIRSTMIALLFVVTMSISTGCATLVRGDSQKVTFQTDPNGATVDINGTNYSAPAEVTLKRKDQYIVTVSAPTYQAIRFELKANWDGASLGNIIMPGGSVGFGVDTLNGADKNFRTLATIKLNKSNGVSDAPLQMYDYRGHIVPKSEYDKAMISEREYHADPGTSP